MLNTIPVKAKPNQTFLTVVAVDDVNTTYLIHLCYRDKINYWTMDITNYTTGDMILSNVPLLTYATKGNEVVFSAIRQMGYLGIGRIYVLRVTDTKEDSPEFLDIETDFDLLWGDS